MTISLLTYCGRFAPSPSGPLHFGSLVAAVASHAEARRRGGAWQVRIEDLDTPRVVPGAADDILRTLEACGMQWDGHIVYQSMRADAYGAALQSLRARGLVYACRCSRREVADSAITGIEGSVYPGTCRYHVDDDPAQGARALRVNTRGARATFDDAVQGTVAQDLESDIGDFVLRRADGIFSYQLAVVVDDGALGVTDVVRGADLLDSTPRQIYLQRLLGLSMPHYMHVPVAVNAHGEKLSKQTRAAAIDVARPATAVVAALRFLGQQPPRELATADVASVWQWAQENWDNARVARARWLAPAGAPR